MQCPPSFKKMIDNGIGIEEAMVKKGELKIYKEGVNSPPNNNIDNNNNDKPKFWNRNRNIVNDGIVNNNNVKPKQPVFNLSNHTTTIQQDNNKPKPTFNNLFCRKFTNIGEPLGSALKTLLANKLITLPEARDFEPKVKPTWWNDNHYCDFHRNKGHQTDDCQWLKHVIEDLIDNGVITVDGHKTNELHTTFETPLPNYEKGESSTMQNGKGKAKVNYVHTYDNMVNVIVVKEKQQREPAHVITRRKSKVTLSGPTTDTLSISKQYSIAKSITENSCANINFETFKTFTHT